MQPKRKFNAHWCGRIWRVSIAVTVSSLAVIAYGIMVLNEFRQMVEPARLWCVFSLILLPCLVLVGSVFFAVIGYSVTPSAVYVHRPFFNVRIPLAKLAMIQVDPGCMHHTTRLLGNGGVFSISGWMYNKRIGRYFAYVTDPQQAVLMRFPKRKVVVVSPARPVEFLAVVNQMRSLQQPES